MTCRARPVNLAVSIYPLDATGKFADCVPIKLGKVSMKNIQVFDDRYQGDRAIFSEMDR